jgi:NADP-dependent 3-hydroxy acid dehydrogenase YdfG
MHEELHPYKIAVTDFYPAAMDTQMFHKVGDMSDRTGALDPSIPAGALLYLCQLPDHVDVPDFSIQSLDY